MGERSEARATGRHAMPRLGQSRARRQPSHRPQGGGRPRPWSISRWLSIDPAGRGTSAARSRSTGLGLGRPGQAEPVAEPLDVGVDHHPRGDPEGVPQDHMGRLATDARQRRQGIEVGRHPAAVPPATARAMPIRFLAFARKNPVEWMSRSTSASSAAARAPASGKRAADRRRVGLHFVLNRQRLKCPRSARRGRCLSGTRVPPLPGRLVGCHDSKGRFFVLCVRLGRIAPKGHRRKAWRFSARLKSPSIPKVPRDAGRYGLRTLPACAPLGLLEIGRASLALKRQASAPASAHV